MNYLKRTLSPFVYKALVSVCEAIGWSLFFAFVGYALWLALSVYLNVYTPTPTIVTVIVIEGRGSQEVAASNPAPLYISNSVPKEKSQAIRKFQPRPEPVEKEVPNVAHGVEISDELLYGLAMKESGGKNYKIGDKHLRYKAYYLYQIRWPYLNDVNKLVGRTRMRQLWGKPALTIADMKDVNKAEWVVRQYLARYGMVYHYQTGKPVTNEVLARIHNGGPDGWKEPVTKRYWQDVKKIAKL